MAKPITNKKGFFILETSQAEILSAHPLNQGICDRCQNSSSIGFFVAVMNYWMCPSCYESWTDESTTIRYSSDIPYEVDKYNALCFALSIPRWEADSRDDKVRYKGNKLGFMKELKHYCQTNNKNLTNEIKEDIWLQLQYHPSPLSFDFKVAYDNATNLNRS